MSLTLIQMLVQLDRLIQDDTDLLDNDTRTAHLLDAVKQYERHRPQKIAQAYTGSGAYDYDLPTSWSQELSEILSIEYPSGEQSPTYIATSRYGVYNNGTTKKLRFYVDTPSASEGFIVNYTTAHTLSSAANTVPDKDQYAVVTLAASICCTALALEMAQSAKGKNPNLADSQWIWRSVNRYKELASNLAEAYYAQVGGKIPGVSAGGRVYNTPSWGTFFNRSF
jgi:hypothetical protein